MDLLDNNVLISAFRPDSPHHKMAKHWLETTLNDGRGIRLFPTVEMGFLRIVTHPGIFDPPSDSEEAWEFLEILCSSPLVEICIWTAGARQQWRRLSSGMGLTGNDFNDAMLAAVALHRRLRLVTFDAGFQRFPGLTCLLLKD